ncbi:MAG: hypothetical protein Q4G28_00315 [Neisseria sp.]|nr:hypothetical protein [Neisseria sp.]
MRTPFDEPKIASVIPPAEWLGVLFLTMIPLVNLAASGYWAFSRRTNPTKANYARTILIIHGLLFVAAAVTLVVLDRGGWLPQLLQVGQ